MAVMERLLSDIEVEERHITRFITAPFGREDVERILPYDDPSAVFIDGITLLWEMGACGVRVVTELDCKGHFGILPAHRLFEMVWQTAACSILTCEGFQGCIAMVDSAGSYENLGLRAKIGQRVFLAATMRGETKRKGKRGSAIGWAWIDGVQTSQMFSTTFEYLILSQETKHRLQRQDALLRNR